MTKIEFYVLPNTNPTTETSTVGRLAEKAFFMGHHIFILTRDEKHSRHLDRELWHFRPDSFVPHSLASKNPYDCIVIDWANPPEHMDDVFINLSGRVPDCFSRFRRLAEIVNPNESSLSASRDSWRFYRDRGYPLAKHDL